VGSFGNEPARSGQVNVPVGREFQREAKARGAIGVSRECRGSEKVCGRKVEFHAG